MKKTIRNFAITMGVVFVLGMGWIVLMSTTTYQTPLMNSTHYVNASVSPIVYTNVDTTGSAGTDSFKIHVSPNAKKIVFTQDHWYCAGVASTNVVTVALYGSTNNGTTYANTAITTYTVTPQTAYSASTFNYAATVNKYEVTTSNGGNPWTDYIWVTTNAATHTASWRSWVMVQ